MGVVSALGHDLPSTWKAVLAGQSAVRNYSADPVLHNQQPLNLALVTDFPFASWKVQHAPSRLASFLAAAATQALSHAHAPSASLDPTRCGICLGSLGSTLTRLTEMMQDCHADHYRTIHRLSMLQVLSSIPAATLNVQLAFKGPALTVSTACASGLSAIVEAAKWVRLGEADFVLAGAAEDVYNPLYLHSSLRLQAMTSKQYASPAQASRPFDRQRSGFVLGEGAGVVVVESL
jgi:3-oxoacyl-[acyl-carrier-protein] synthase II